MNFDKYQIAKDLTDHLSDNIESLKMIESWLDPNKEVCLNGPTLNEDENGLVYIDIPIPALLKDEILNLAMTYFTQEIDISLQSFSNINFSKKE